MVVNDIVGYMLTRIRNSMKVKSEIVYIPKSNLTMSISKILLEEGFISSFEDCTKVFVKRTFDNSFIRIYLKYKGVGQHSYITSFKRVSRPGLRVYVNNSNVGSVWGGIGIAVISTSQGLMSDRSARMKKIGGEVLFYVW
uniref:ribosomal protein S8 n=1 Tax=Flexiglena variabilis TaxID=2743688 RepID=UPI0023AAED10|nr:ribosomal protein S8 [Flexiglena variabilis]WCH63481.1 ribosomal protein S8 [Flexiglena variabilis]